MADMLPFVCFRANRIAMVIVLLGLFAGCGSSEEPAAVDDAGAPFVEASPDGSPMHDAGEQREAAADTSAQTDGHAEPDGSSEDALDDAGDGASRDGEADGSLADAQEIPDGGFAIVEHGT